MGYGAVSFAMENTLRKRTVKKSDVKMIKSIRPFYVLMDKTHATVAREVILFGFFRWRHKHE